LTPSQNKILQYIKQKEKAYKQNQKSSTEVVKKLYTNQEEVLEKIKSENDKTKKNSKGAGENAKEGGGSESSESSPESKFKQLSESKKPAKKSLSKKVSLKHAIKTIKIKFKQVGKSTASVPLNNTDEIHNYTNQMNHIFDNSKFSNDFDEFDQVPSFLRFKETSSSSSSSSLLGRKQDKESGNPENQESGDDK